MARLGITYAQVAEAAEELKQKGLEPTMTLVRDVLGTGGFSTISAHLAQWRNKEISKPAQKPMTQEVEDAALKAIKQIWHIACEDAEKEISRINLENDAYKLQVRKDIEERDKAIKELDGYLEKQENDLAELQRKIKELEIIAATKEGKIQQLAEINNKLLAEIKQLEAALAHDKTTGQKPKKEPVRENKQA